MFSVSSEIYKIISLAAHYLFAFFALMLFIFAVLWLYDERRKRRERFRSLPEAGSIGEMVVISGSSQLPADTWFPVPREGILGSLRSCDLVVPCPGVHARHLDFSWQDGTGLLIKPYAGCETFVDGISLITAERLEMPVMVHGSCLQVGSAVLRLQLLSALEHTNRPFAVSVPPPEYTGQSKSLPPFPYATSVKEPELPFTSNPVQDFTVHPCLQEKAAGVMPADCKAASDHQAELVGFDGMPVSEGKAPLPEPSSHRRRADRWKEDFSE